MTCVCWACVLQEPYAEPFGSGSLLLCRKVIDAYEMFCIRVVQVPCTVSFNGYICDDQSSLFRLDHFIIPPMFCGSFPPFMLTYVQLIALIVQDECRLRFPCRDDSPVALQDHCFYQCCHAPSDLVSPSALIPMLSQWPVLIPMFRLGVFPDGELKVRI